MTVTVSLIMLNDFRKSDKGNVTVFLCMIFGIVLALAVSVISILRYRWEKTQIIRSGRIAVCSEFSKYYRPLYDSYRLFYYIDCDDNQMQAGIGGYFLENQKNMPPILALKPSYVDVTEKFYSTSNEAQNVVMQMKDALFQEGIDDLFDEKTEFSDKKVIEDIREEIGLLKDAAKAEKLVLELVRLVDGISISEGEVNSVNVFVKQMVFAEVTPSVAGVDSEIVWNETKKYYFNAKDVLNKLVKVTQKAIKGKAVVFPTKDIARLKEYVKTTKEKTIEAHGIVSEILRMVPKNMRSELICDIVSLENILAENKIILEQLETFAQSTKPLNKKMWEQYLNQISNIYNMISGYNISGMRFDYSTLVAKKCDDPRERAGDNVSGILDILLEDDADISDKNVAETDIYLGLMKGEAKKCSESMYRFDNDFDKLEEFVGGFAECIPDTEEDWADKITIISYATMYLNSFSKKVSVEDVEIKEHVLEYEREYLIAGNNSDRKNLQDVVNKLLLGRTGLSFTALVNNAECRSKTFVTAQQLVGFSGMQSLVKVVQYSILAAWAYEDACVDVAILLEGNKIATIKNSNQINIEYEEMCLFNEKLVRIKAEENKCETGSDYDKCLAINLLAQQKTVVLYRILDIIQQNMKINCDKRFSFQNAMYGAKVAFGCCEPYDCHAEISYVYE